MLDHQENRLQNKKVGGIQLMSNEITYSFQIYQQELEMLNKIVYQACLHP